MRVIVSQQDTNRHSDACTSAQSSLGGEIISGSDDGSVWRWSSAGDPQSKVFDAPACVTHVRWMPGSGRKKVTDASRDSIIVACADGVFFIVSAQSGRIEKKVEAHTGAITGLTWNVDGSSMITAGEDGVIKVWSQAGIQRSTLCSVGKCIYCLVFGAESPDFGGECLLYTTGTDVSIKPVNAGVKKQLHWKAHTGVILCADWSRMTNLIITGGEDGCYRVWDSYGRPLYQASVGDYPVTSISFAPDGDLFAVGSFMHVRICDKTGWTYCRQPTTGGSVQSVGWTPDGTQVVMGGGGGNLAVGQLVGRTKHWGTFTATLVDERRLRVHDIASDTTEDLEQRDPVIKISMGYGHIVVATTTQCVIYDVTRLLSPVQFDLRDAVVSLQQTEKAFFIADCTQGIQIYSYEGRQSAVAKVPATLRPDQLAPSLISLSKDAVAMRDPADPRRILFFDSMGKPLPDTVVAHHMDIIELQLSHFGQQQDRKLVFIDRNRDLYLVALHGAAQGAQKIATMAAAACWNDTTETLVALADGRLVTWACPAVVFIDRDLLARTKSVRDDGDEFGRHDQIADFFGTRVAVRRGQDGALLTYAISPYPAMLFGHVTKSDWAGAVRLCRFLKEESLWGALAALAVKAGEFETAEAAYAALDEVDKLRFLTEAKKVPTVEGRQAELALFQRRPDQAERILMQAGLTFRAIELYMNLHMWERALEIALKAKTHVDTVIAFRQQHLEGIGRRETSDKFKQVAHTFKSIDMEAIKKKIADEHAKEAERGKPYKPAR